MKVLVKLTSIALLAILLTFVACSTPPPVVDKDQFLTAGNETMEAEKAATASEKELKELETELSRKEAELRSLKDYERQLGF